MPPTDAEEAGFTPWLSNTARYFWSTLDRVITSTHFSGKITDHCMKAYEPHVDDRNEESRELILETLMRGSVPIACRCQLLQLLACLMPWEQGQDCLNEAEELCQEMDRLVPYSEQVTELRTKNADLRSALQEEHAIPDDDDEPEEGDEKTAVLAEENEETEE